MPDFCRVDLQNESEVNDWTLLKSGRKLGWDVCKVRNTAGTPGVIKTARARGNPDVCRQRFVHEVKVMSKLQQLTGVLRVLDQDPSPEPTWMVTELATNLVGYLGPKPDFRAVVSAFADLADTLIEAAAETPPIAHRDIKPPNLFHVRGRAVLGDFGLATGHDHDNLTRDGAGRGPANFSAPETFESIKDTDWFSADVFSLAKSLWAVAASQKYPPQGQLLIRLPEVDLGRFGGRPADDLARLLEIATATRPTARPTMAIVRDELKTWLDLYPEGSTPRPEKGRMYPSLFDELYSERALQRLILGQLLDRAVHQTLNDCRGLWQGSSHVTTDSDANLDMEDQLADLFGGDPDDRDWSPDHIVTKKLVWDDRASVRLVASGILLGEDDLHYYVSWQIRDTTATSRWTVAWRKSASARMRLPSELAVRQQLQSEIADRVPPQLTSPALPPPPDVAADLDSLTDAARQRDSERVAAQARLTARQQAADEAIDQFDLLWKELADYLGTRVPNVHRTRDQDTWMLILSEDRRVIVKISKPATNLYAAVQLGIVTVEAEDNAYGSEVANLYAAWDSAGPPVWHLMRMVRNDASPTKVLVSVALSDGLGAISVDHLEKYFEEEKRRVAATLATKRVSEVLTFKNLTKLIAAEVVAIDRHLKK